MRKLITVLIVVFMLCGCASNPLTGKNTMAFVSNAELFPMAFAQYDEFLNENIVISDTADAEMVERVGTRLAAAAEKWLRAEGNAHYLDGYEWDYRLVEDDTVNAWCMPGGKIVVYTGILPVTRSEAGLAVVLGHEVSHALLNHGQQRMSAGTLQEIGNVGLAMGMGLFGISQQTQALAMTAYGIGSELGGTLPFSRSHESEADRYGLTLMAIAGYNPDEAAPFWERMASLGGGGTPELLSTHPSDETRIKNLRSWNAEAKKKAAEFGVTF